MVRRFEKLPFFDERFINYGHNKIQWIEHLRYSGFEFNVLSHSYAVDIPHQSLLSRYRVRNRSEYSKTHLQELHSGKARTAWLYREFLYEIRHNQKDESRVLLCLPHGNPLRVVSVIDIEPYDS